MSLKDENQLKLPPLEQMFTAFEERDPSFDGVFYTGVRTTGIFCRPTCRARKPKRANVEFFPTAGEALANGYRPCLVCHPLAASGRMPDWIAGILREVHNDPAMRLTDHELRQRGVDPVRLRRWFKANAGMTFHDYCRSLRVGRALSAISSGDTTTGAAFDSGYESLSGFGDAVKQVAGSPPSIAGSAEPVLLAPVATPLGTMIAGATRDHLLLLEFADRRGLGGQLQSLARRTGRVTIPGRTGIHDHVSSELTEYFSGERTAFTVPLDLPGTDFQKAAWQALLDVPYGRTRSYADQAAEVGRPEAVRAVARANGQNRIAILVPCHRIIGSDGRLTGYGGGLWRKQRLLDLEAGRVRF